jgi:3-phosphoshikimate 1-carboxyvinyltransferase
LSQITLFPRLSSFSEIIPLPASKSESNRALVINALANGTIDNLSNLAEARDTQTMIRLLSENGVEADVLDAGTTMRFLTAYYAVTGATKKMTGTPRMCERPIGILVDALRTLGADITYLNQEGYPPMQLNSFSFKGNREISIRGDVSSQFISALLMVAPLLPDGLKMQITGALGSKPYIEMTLAQMKHFGIQASADWSKGTIEIPAQKYTLQPFAVESDWSGASYWYSMVALSPFEDSSLELLGLKEDSLQGDSAIKEIMEPLGVKSTYTGRGYMLTKIPAQTSLAWDFTDCPDLAQTICVVAAVQHIPLTLTGLESLKVKETDRVLALQNELKKLGATLVEKEANHLYEVSGNFAAVSTIEPIETYDDHRMAMAFAPVAMHKEITLLDPSVVNKSYPSFWKHVSLLLKSTL